MCVEKLRYSTIKILLGQAVNEEVLEYVGEVGRTALYMSNAECHVHLVDIRFAGIQLPIPFPSEVVTGTIGPASFL